MSHIDHSKWDNIDTDSEPEISTQQATAPKATYLKVSCTSFDGNSQRLRVYPNCTDVPWLSLKAEDLPIPASCVARGASRLHSDVHYMQLYPL